MVRKEGAMADELIAELMQIQNDLLREFYEPQIRDLEAMNKELRDMLKYKIIQQRHTI